MSQTGKFHVHTYHKNQHWRPSGMYLRNRNDSDSSSLIVKVADCLAMFTLVIKKPRGRKRDSQDKWKPGFSCELLPHCYKSLKAVYVSNSLCQTVFVVFNWYLSYFLDFIRFD